jgi:hypothetical protein
MEAAETRTSKRTGLDSLFIQQRQSLSQLTVQTLLVVVDIVEEVLRTKSHDTHDDS